MNGNSAALWSSLTPDSHGLVVTVVQHAQTGQILMVGYMNKEALTATIERKRVTFWSRSRGQLWEKGESSGNTLDLVELRTDCDRDALLAQAIPRGPACHNGTTSCFTAPLDRNTTDDGPPVPGGVMVSRVFDVVLERKAGRGATNEAGKSYVRALLEAGLPKIGEKVLEEASELAHALTRETADRVVAETADLFFHAMVGLAARGLHLRDIEAVFAERFGLSGLDEKAARAEEALKRR